MTTSRTDQPLDPRYSDLQKALDDLMVLVHGMRQELCNYRLLPSVGQLTRQVRVIADAELEIRGWAPPPQE